MPSRGDHVPAPRAGPVGPVATRAASRGVGRDWLASVDSGLGAATIRGARWNLLSQAYRLLFGLASLALLSRLMSADDFGLFAMSQGFMGCLGIITEGGLSFSTVQRSSLTQQQASNLFWMNVALGLSMAAVGIVSSPALAAFFGRQELVGIGIALSGALVIQSLGLQHVALLRRNLMQGRAMLVSAAAVTVGAGAGISVAFLGGRWWALVAQAVGSALGGSCAAWIVCGWRPGAWRSGVGTKQILWTGGTWNLSELLGHVRRSIDQTLVGWYWGAEALGVYARSAALIGQAVLNVVIPLGAALSPALSRIQDQPDRYRTAFRQAAGVMMFFTVPACVFALASAPDFARLVLGPRWDGCVPIVRAMGPFVFTYCSVIPLVGIALNSLGLARRLLRLGVFNLLAIGTACGACIAFGPDAVALGAGLSTAAVALVTLRPAVRGTPLAPGDLLRPIAAPAAFAAVAAAAALGSRQALGDAASPVIALAVSGTAFSGAYCVLWAAHPRGREHLVRVTHTLMSRA